MDRHPGALEIHEWGRSGRTDGNYLRNRKKKKGSREIKKNRHGFPDLRADNSKTSSVSEVDCKISPEYLRDFSGISEKTHFGRGRVTGIEDRSRLFSCGGADG